MKRRNSSAACPHPSVELLSPAVSLDTPPLLASLLLRDRGREAPYAPCLHAETEREREEDTQTD